MMPLHPLANHLWQSTLFAALAALLTLLLRGNRAQSRYWLWLAASVKFLIPFSVLVAAGSCPGAGSFDPETGKASGQSFINMCGWLKTGKDGGSDVNGTSMANLCRVLSSLSDRDVIDKTGLAGMFDIHLDTHAVERPPHLNDPDVSAPVRAADMALFTDERFAQLQAALPKLGLKLEPAKGSADFLVIDHIERPSVN